MIDRARILLAQHAETTRLLGVDFLPLGRPVEVAGFEPAADEEPRPAPRPAPKRDFAPAPQAPSAPVFEPAAPKPAAQAAWAATIDAGSVRACHQHLTDPRAKLDAVREKYIADAPHQHFVTAHTNIVFGEGDPAARLMFVGEAPGETEDQTGRPFVGRAGQLLEKMINAMGLKREDVYICNVLKTRPPNNATPTSDEARLCAPYLIEQIRIVAPEAIVTLGLPATHLLLETTEPMRSARGRWWTFPPQAGVMADPDLPEISVMPTYHPAYLLRSYTDENRRKVWSDLKAVMDRLGMKSGS
jgi:DNA polymerase